MADKRDKLPTEASGRKEVDAFLRRVAMAPSPRQQGQRGRLIFAMDATASREPTWDRACHIQAEMFEATDALGGLDVQLVFYRGFRECKASPWVSNTEDLRRRMTAVGCLAGHTQLRRVLKHTLAETAKRRVDALVFVGDCFEEDPDAVGHLAGELGLRGVPAFVFQEGDDPVARRMFGQVARLTRGAYCRFDLSSAQQLKDLLGAVAVYAAGGRKALASYGGGRGQEVRQITAQLGRGK